MKDKIRWFAINNLYKIILFLYKKLMNDRIDYTVHNTRTKVAEFFRKAFVVPIYFKKHYDINLYPFEEYKEKGIIL